MFFRHLAVVAIMLGVSACSTVKTKELSAGDAARLKQKSLVYATSSKLPDFSAQTAANVQFGMLGLAAAISSGNAMIRNNGVEDPAISIAKKLSEVLEVKHGVKLATDAGKIAASNKVPDLVSAHANVDYVLHVRTLGWGSIYYLSDWNNYRVMYSAHARLIDTAGKTVIAEEVCTAKPEHANPNAAPSYADLEAGAALRQELASAVDICVDHIVKMVKLAHIEAVAER